MANRTVKDAVTVKGTNPQYLVEKIIRTRIYDSRYWKEECFALSAELLVDKAMQLKYVGGVFGDNVKVTPFLCLTLKMLQIQPEKDIVIEFIKNEDYKYVRVLGAYYMRLTGTSLDCYNYIEPLLNDYRKVRLRNRQGGYELSHVDQFVDALLRDERMCDVILPRIQRRQVLEESGELEPRVSALDDDLDDLPIDNDHIDDDDDDDDDDDRADSLEDLQMTRSTTAAAAAAAANGGGGHSNSYHGDAHWRHRDHRGHRDTRDYRDSRGYREDRDRYRYREEERGGGGGGGGRRSAERYHHRERRSDGRRSRERERVRAHGRSGRQREEDDQPGRQRQSRHERHHRHKERRKRHRSASGDDHQRRQIDEANALRAKLGLAPLRP